MFFRRCCINHHFRLKPSCGFGSDPAAGSVETPHVTSGEIWGFERLGKVKNLLLLMENDGLSAREPQKSRLRSREKGATLLSGVVLVMLLLAGCTRHLLKGPPPVRHPWLWSHLQVLNWEKKAPKENC